MIKTQKEVFMTETQKTVEVKEEHEEEKPDIVLDCRIKGSGGMEWTIPKDLRIAIHLHKHLELLINEMYMTNFRNASQPKESIKNKIMKGFRGFAG